MITILTNALATLSVLSAAPAVGAVPDTSTQPITGGPVIPGVCLVSPEAVLTGSKVGQSVNARLQHLATEAEATMKTERAALDTDAHNLQTETKGLTASQADEKRQALSGRLQAFQAKVDRLNRQLEYTRISVIQRISQQAQPVMAAAYTAHGCGLLFRRSDMVGGNPANDITAEVVRNLDAKITTLTFDLESPPAQTASATPAA